MERNLHGQIVCGVNLDQESRCAHYATSLDIVALKCICCEVFYACHQCHQELVVAAFEPWPASRKHEPSVLCGHCGQLMTFESYLSSNYQCLNCRAAFNPGCGRHTHFYFSSSEASQEGKS
ncbi:CHY zinc finger protein [Salsuginibacillus kocurii]|uniref:CHY zinc finger protein n=1 Tax=Salsuginibacillus kocurii TaxID=427078 RepID=UPI00058B6BA2